MRAASSTLLGGHWQSGSLDGRRAGHDPLLPAARADGSPAHLAQGASPSLLSLQRDAGPQARLSRAHICAASDLLMVLAAQLLSQLDGFAALRFSAGQPGLMGLLGQLCVEPPQAGWPGQGAGEGEAPKL